MKKVLSAIPFLILIVLINTVSCSRVDRIDPPISTYAEGDEYLDINSSVDIYHLYTLSEKEIINLCRAIGRIGIYKEGNQLKYFAESPEEINVSQRLYSLIVKLLENNSSMATRASSPSDCVAYALSFWGDYDYNTINAYITGIYGNDGVPETDVFGVIKHFYPGAKQHSPDSIDASFIVSAITTIGYFPTGGDNAHMVNIDSIDSVGVVTYVDIQGGYIGYNAVSDYTYFYTKY